MFRLEFCSSCQRWINEHLGSWSLGTRGYQMVPDGTSSKWHHYFQRLRRPHILDCTSSLWRKSEAGGEWRLRTHGSYDQQNQDMYEPLWTNFKMFSCISSLISVKYQRASHVDLGPSTLRRSPVSCNLLTTRLIVSRMDPPADFVVSLDQGCFFRSWTMLDAMEKLFGRQPGATRYATISHDLDD